MGLHAIRCEAMWLTFDFPRLSLRRLDVIGDDSPRCVFAFVLFCLTRIEGGLVLLLLAATWSHFVSSLRLMMEESERWVPLSTPRGCFGVRTLMASSCGVALPFPFCPTAPRAHTPQIRISRFELTTHRLAILAFRRFVLAARAGRDPTWHRTRLGIH